MTIPHLERFAEILKRELEAQDVVIASETDPAANQTSDTTLTWPLGHGKILVLTFATSPIDLQDKLSRLTALSESFAHLFAEAAPELPRSRPKPSAILQSELDALAGSAHASSALIIDAKSPVIWGASEAPTDADDNPLDSQVQAAFNRAKEIGISWRNLLTRPPGPSTRGERKESKNAADPGRSLRLVPPLDELAGLEPNEREIIAQRAELARRAITRIRENDILPQLHRGEHLHEAILDDSVAYLARSFASIYVLILVFPGPFDELGAERALARALPIIERLVVSLPPDDTPETRKGAVVALRPRRRQ